MAGLPPEWRFQAKPAIGMPVLEAGLMPCRRRCAVSGIWCRRDWRPATANRRRKSGIPSKVTGPGDLRKPPLEVFPDMKRQPKLRPQKVSPFFADERTSRLQVPGTVAVNAM